MSEAQTAPADTLRGAGSPRWAGLGREWRSEPGLSGPELAMILLL